MSADAAPSPRLPDLSEADAVPPTLLSILSSDVAGVITQQLESIADVAALWRSLAPLQPVHLRWAVEARAAILILDAPVWSAAGNFEDDALWPITVAACDWHPRPFFASLRQPAFCKVAGSGTCSHGLCQKQEMPKEGVLELFELLAGKAGDDACVATQLTRTTAIECAAWLCGAVGRHEAAEQYWMRAASQGSARALLDIGLRLYRTTGSASTLYSGPHALKTFTTLPTLISSGRAPGASGGTAAATAAGHVSGGRAADTAEALLRRAKSNPALQSLGLEGHVIRARSLMTLGMMALDGDGAAQDDAAAFHAFEGAVKAVKAGLARPSDFTYEVRLDRVDGDGSQLVTGIRSVHTAPSGSKAARPLVPDEVYSKSLVAHLLKVEEDAQEAMGSMDRFFFFANGRP